MGLTLLSLIEPVRYNYSPACGSLTWGSWDPIILQVHPLSTLSVSSLEPTKRYSTFTTVFFLLMVDQQLTMVLCSHERR